MTPDKQRTVAQRIAQLVSSHACTLFFVRGMDSSKHDPVEVCAEYEDWLTQEVIEILKEEND